MKELGAEPEECIYVGDSEVDIETAANAGIPCISVTWGFKSAEFLRRQGADHIVSSAEELDNVHFANIFLKISKKSRFSAGNCIFCGKESYFGE